MKRTILFSVVAICLVLIWFYFGNIYGWRVFRQNSDTPIEFLSHTTIKEEDYAKDSSKILDQLIGLLSKHRDFFQNSAYDDSTELIIDSVLYSPDYSRLAVLLITGNPTNRQLAPNREYERYYDATIYLGVRRNDSIVLYWIGPRITNSNNKEDISNDIRSAAFRTFATKEGSEEYKYNLNDKRFWSSTIWGKVSENETKERELEEEKKKHPENVFEPKK